METSDKNSNTNGSQKKRKYTVYVGWEMYADVEVEAFSLEEAIKIVEDEWKLPDNGEYVDGSYEINEEVTKEINNENI